MSHFFRLESMDRWNTYQPTFRIARFDFILGTIHIINNVTKESETPMIIFSNLINGVIKSLLGFGISARSRAIRTTNIVRANSFKVIDK
jgi:hypothetical protein